MRAPATRRLRGLAAALGEPRHAHDHGVPDGAWQRDVGLQRELQAVWTGGQAGRVLERRRQLLDEERRAARAVVQDARQLRAGRAPREQGEQLTGSFLVERLDDDLLQRAVAPEIVSQPAQRMRPRQLVGAVRRDDEQRHRAQRQRQRGEQLERRLVGPLQVVEQDRGGPLGDHPREPAADRLHERRAVGAGAPLAELREEHGEMGAQRPAAVEAARDGAQVLPERSDDRPVRGLRGRRGAAQQPRPAIAERLLGQPGLADARLPGEEKQAAASGDRALERGAQPR